MKLLRKKRLVIPAIVGVVGLASAGVAYAFFSSTGTGKGSAQVGTTAALRIAQLNGSAIYDSTIAPYGTVGPYSGSNVGPSQQSAYGYQWSYAYTATQANQLGNEITVSNPGGLPLGNVVVAMANFTPAAQSQSIPITFNIWSAPSGSPANGTTVPSGSLIATDTVNVTPPGTVSGGNPNTGAGTDDFNVTFDFSSQNVTLSDGENVVYGISYNDSTVDTGLNVQLAYADNSPSISAPNPSVGSDTNPGWLWVSTYSGQNGATGGTGGEITCQNVNSTFAEYSTVAGSGCGLQNFSSASEDGYLVPAVQFNTVGSSMSGLYPGGPAQPVSFSVTNPGSSPAQVQKVAIGVATDASNGYAETPTGADITGCLASWFQVAGSPLTVNQSIPASQTIDFIGKASISLTNAAVSQDACKGATVGLTFTSS